MYHICGLVVHIMGFMYLWWVTSVSSSNQILFLSHTESCDDTVTHRIWLIYENLVNTSQFPVVVFWINLQQSSTIIPLVHITRSCETTFCQNNQIFIISDIFETASFFHIWKQEVFFHIWKQDLLDSSRKKICLNGCVISWMKLKLLRFKYVMLVKVFFAGDNN